MSLSGPELKRIRDIPLNVVACPVHTVVVERAVKVVTEAASAVAVRCSGTVQPSTAPTAAAGCAQQKNCSFEV